MPELPEVETTRRGLLKFLRGKTIARAEIHVPALRLPIPRDLKKYLADAQVTEIERRAKYMIWQLSSGRRLLVHLGMSGRFRHAAAGKCRREKHDHVTLHLSDGTVLSYHDPRRFGFIVWAENARGQPHPWLENAGMEPLSKDLTPAWLHAQLQRRKLPMKAALLDQKMIAGLGNIYVSEALFLAGILPTRAAHRVTLPECETLVTAIQKTLRAAIRAGGSSLRDYRDVDGQIGSFQNRFLVYDRAGQACRTCAAPIQHLTQSARSSYFCTGCQS